MGNTSTKAQRLDTFDGGQFEPHGVYPEQDQDFDRRVVRRLILDRKLAPFYKGAEEPAPDTDEDDDNGPGDLPRPTDLPLPPTTTGPSKQVGSNDDSVALSGPAAACMGAHHQASRSLSHLPTGRRERPTSCSSNLNAPTRSRAGLRPSPLSPAQEDALYKRGLECPICFLYYPKNINYSRCCHHPICTECFVQFKRQEPIYQPTPCPFCVEAHFGIVYTPAVLSSQPNPLLQPTLSHDLPSSPSAQSSSSKSSRCRSRSLSHDHPSVVRSDALRPHILRIIESREQTGNRTSLFSHRRLLPRMDRPRRQRTSRDRSSDSQSPPSTIGSQYNGYVHAMHHMGADLEELMVMEAIRLSMQEEQDRQEHEQRRQSTSPPDAPSDVPEPSTATATAASEPTEPASDPVSPPAHTAVAEMDPLRPSDDSGAGEPSPDYNSHHRDQLCPVFPSSASEASSNLSAQPSLAPRSTLGLTDPQPSADRPPSYTTVTNAMIPGVTTRPLGSTSAAGPRPDYPMTTTAASSGARDNHAV
ncbi:SNF1-interacting protein [Dimargaris verticillata]|uniref:SNF1-interacting protein n=1 Tax=Dimargaris verticillata TaxID=2761393 RepID=A0A9W8E6V2_9FUNG|nr:SNF1-interacting protein [Dimargaris verticillata]